MFDYSKPEIVEANGKNLYVWTTFNGDMIYEEFKDYIRNMEYADEIAARLAWDKKLAVCFRYDENNETQIG